MVLVVVEGMKILKMMRMVMMSIPLALQAKVLKGDFLYLPGYLWLSKTKWKKPTREVTLCQNYILYTRHSGFLSSHHIFCCRRHLYLLRTYITLAFFYGILNVLLWEELAAPNVVPSCTVMDMLQGHVVLWA